GKRADHAEHRRRQHRLPDDQGTGRCAARRTDSDRRGAAGAYSDTVDDGARRREYEGGRGRGGATGRGKPAAAWLYVSLIAPHMRQAAHRMDRPRIFLIIRETDLIWGSCRW